MGTFFIFLRPKNVVQSGSLFRLSLSKYFRVLINHESAMQVRIINVCVEILFSKRELRCETQANSNVLINL
jgi:hypothetical protein